jgi:hypothetical protein
MTAGEISRQWRDDKVNLQKLNVKVFVEQPNQIPLTEFIDVFHGWIQATDGVYHDVADYSHMKDGPGIVLVAREAHVSMDETGGRRGLLYSRKTPLPGTAQQKLAAMLRFALENCRRLTNEPALKARLRFRADEVEIAVNDRLAAPNTKESFETLKPDLDRAARRLFGTVGYALTHKEDSRQRFTVTMRAARLLSLEALFTNLSAEANGR